MTMTSSLPLSKVAAHVLILAGALGLVGCAQGLEGLVAVQERDSFILTSSVNEATPTTALASLPRQAGRVLSVREQREAGGLHQHIVMQGDELAAGENWIKVGVRESRLVEAISMHELHTEMTTAFNGRALPLYNYVINNEHGPVGLAYGPVAGHGNCAYIWQQAQHSDVQATDQLPFAHDAGVWSARVRLCRERLTQEHAIAFAQGLSLGAFSDPLYAPLTGAANTQALVIDPTSLASLDAPVRAAPRALRGLTARSAVRSPTPREVLGVHNAVAVPVPSDARLAPRPAQAVSVVALPASPMDQTSVSIPLPQ